MPTSKKRRKRAGKDPVAENSAANRKGFPLLLAGLAVAVTTGGAAFWISGKDDGAHFAVSVPNLTGAAVAGAELFAANCERCHGRHAAGSKVGPPLVHKIYEPGHHGDGAFYSAVARGVRAHHWPYGNMPPIHGLSSGKVGSIVAYVRALQVENGIR